MHAPRTVQRAAAFAAGTACLVMVTACSGEQSVEPVSPGALEEQIADAMEDEVGVRPSVTCEEELPAEEGAEATCDVANEDDPDSAFTVTATVTSVDTETGTVEFDLSETDRPQDGEDGQEGRDDQG